MKRRVCFFIKEMFFSKAIEVVNVTNNDTTVDLSYKFELDGATGPQARPRVGRNGMFYNPKNKEFGLPLHGEAGL